jgi:hypothetical protein
MDWMNGFQILVGAENFLFAAAVLDRAWAHSAPYPICVGVFSRLKRPAREL